MALDVFNYEDAEAVRAAGGKPTFESLMQPKPPKNGIYSGHLPSWGSWGQCIQWEPPPKVVKSATHRWLDWYFSVN